MRSVDGNVNIDWYRSPLEKETLRQLTARSDLHGFLQIVTQLLLTTATGAGAYYVFYHYAWYAFLPAFFVHATVFSFLGLSGAGHELSHGTVFKTRFWNDFFTYLVSFLSWTNMAYFRASHPKHHQMTVYAGLDLEVVQPLKYQRLDWVKFFTFNWSAFYFVISTAIRHSRGLLKTEWEQRIFPEKNVQKRRELARWARMLLLGHLLMAGAFIYFEQYLLLLLISFAPFFAGWLNFLCGFTQHAGLPSSVPDFRLCCRTVLLNPLLRFFYWQMNYHVEHHMYPGVPFFKLGSLRKAIADDLPPAFGLIASWRRLFAILRQQQLDPQYVYVPELPQQLTAAEVG